MKKLRKALLLYSFCSVFVIQALGAAEKTLILGASSGWNTVEKRTQVEEFASVRPYKVLALSSAWTGSLSSGGASAPPRGAGEDILALYAAYRNFPGGESALDLALNFDESRADRFSDAAGHYQVQVPPSVQAVNERWARYGSGAALFAGQSRDGGITLIPGRSSLFAPGRNVRDFSIEFWLYPNAMENGEQICTFAAADNQRISGESLRNRLRWTFENFFSPPGNRGQRLTITIESRTALVPRTWTHHLLRYNADRGLLEYLINGRVENIAYTTGSGREGGDVYTPRLNRDGSFILGSRFSGMIDEFRIYNRVIEAPGRTALEQQSHTGLELPELAKFPRNGGRIETGTIDLGEKGSVVLRIEASGGRLTPSGRGAARMAVKNVYAGQGNFRFPDNSALQFFIRAGEEPYRFGQIPWIPVVPGEEISAAVKGRYVQLAAAFYPSGDCETSPYLEAVRIVYDSNEAPYPPSLVIARALDGAVELSWRTSPDADTRGYLVYYGTSAGVYYGQGSLSSPINAGNRTSLRIDGLRNGTLYFFAIAAYDGTGLRPEDLHPGKFSKEVSARPLRMTQ
jgi:hypothetical protein